MRLLDPTLSPVQGRNDFVVVDTSILNGTANVPKAGQRFPLPPLDSQGRQMMGVRFWPQELLDLKTNYLAAASASILLTLRDMDGHAFLDRVSCARLTEGVTPGVPRVLRPYWFLPRIVDLTNSEVVLTVGLSVGLIPLQFVYA